MPIKAVRFDEYEEACISEFLSNNPHLNFSTIARISILDFIKNPKISIKPIEPLKDESEVKRE